LECDGGAVVDRRAAAAANADRHCTRTHLLAC
jgi:hypothetical protein